MTDDFPLIYFEAEQFVFARLDEEATKPDADMVKLQALRMLATWHSIYVDHDGVSHWKCATCDPIHGAPCITMLLLATTWHDHPDMPEWIPGRVATFELGKNAADAGGWFALAYPGGEPKEID